MRRTLTALILAVLLAGSLLVASFLGAAPASASVPDKPFTQTLCEGDTDSIARLYTAGLGREPEQGGFDFWVTEYSLGNWTFPRMAQFFVTSPEFQESYGELNQDEFIRQLYRNVLGREGESGGIIFWNEQMDLGMTRATVLMRFAESPENITNSGTVEPTLGPFNEGRPEGHWRCGPPLADSLLQVSDFPDGTVRSLASFLSDDGLGSCETAFFMPEGSEGFMFAIGPDQDPLMFQGSYIAPTKHGADRVMAQLREALANCGTYIDRAGDTVTATALDIPEYGDDTVGIEYFVDGFFGPVRSQAVLIQDGPVVALVQNVSFSAIDSGLTEQYAALMAERLAALPFNP